MQHIGKVEKNEMYRTFNMGVGMVFIVDPSNVNIVKNVLNNLTEVYEIGNVVKGKKEVSV
jgi:phosphoribosylformylglycinamidine cyclo-ligase